MTPTQISTVKAYLQKRFGIDGFDLRARKVADSVEVYLNDEILGLLYIDDEDADDISYDLNISILQQDLTD
ncbi:DUF3126 family protein [Robiginitomaculum antarcticum]|uniref:DUF3126 family protein n=1 Tax=Robiginitomaculum antarcticum TaxID=437507 RepID=UPI000360F526|nr:DUF3126 family protein [Robiginitomaculum antarcticum]